MHCNTKVTMPLFHPMLACNSLCYLLSRDDEVLKCTHYVNIGLFTESYYATYLVAVTIAVVQL